MARKKRQFTTFNLSFLDIMSCGFGAVVLVFLIIDHSIEVEMRDLNVRFAIRGQPAGGGCHRW